MKTKTKKRAGGPKFTETFGVALASVYKDAGTLKSLKIPPPGHVLFDPTAPKSFDPLRVEAIDRDGTMTDPIEVWSDPDTKTLWVLDGRGRLLDVEEVNRRRAEDNRAPVEPYLVRFVGNEKAAVARVREKNYHRRAPTVSGMGLDIAAMRKAGHSWEACAKALHVETDAAEKWCRKRLPLAFCTSEVRAAFDAGEFPLSVAGQFGGYSTDGETALGSKEQLALLEQKRAEKLSAKDAPKVKQVSPKVRERLRHALSNGKTASLTFEAGFIAKGAAAILAFIEGDAEALKPWPDVEAIAREALLAKKEKSGEEKGGD